MGVADSAEIFEKLKSKSVLPADYAAILVKEAVQKNVRMPNPCASLLFRYYTSKLRTSEKVLRNAEHGTYLEYREYKSLDKNDQFKRYKSLRSKRLFGEEEHLDKRGYYRRWMEKIRSTGDSATK